MGRFSGGGRARTGRAPANGFLVSLLIAAAFHTSATFAAPAASVASARPACTEGLVLEGPLEGQHLVAGQQATVAWDRLPADVDEVELLLSLDGGRRFPIRLTASLDPAAGRARFSVPPLPTTGGRLRLRAGRGAIEEEGPPSEPFVVCVPPSAPAARLVERDGEWWVAEGSVPGPSWIAGCGETFGGDDEPSGRDAEPESGDEADRARRPVVAPVPLEELAPRAPLSAAPSFAPGPEAPKR